MREHVAQIGYSREHNRIEVIVPHGTKTADLSKYMAVLFSNNIISRLPRGCQTCTSGDHLLIREELADVIQVDLEQKAVIGA